MVHADSHRIPRVRCYSGSHTRYHDFTPYRTLTSYGPAFQPRSAYIMIYSTLWRQSSMFPLPRICNAASFNTYTVLGSSPFARRYSGNRFYFLFLRLLRCFSSPAYLSRAYPPGMQVLPFGYPGITGPVHLLRAFRSLARPSSASTA